MPASTAKARENMVDCQIRTADVTQRNLVDAFLEVPREKFAPAERQMLAFVDNDIPIGGGRAIMAPASLARLLQAARIRPDAYVLDIGCGTGYSAAIISRICESVVAVEDTRELVDLATNTLAELEYDNAVVVEGSLPEGYPSEGPFDVIFLGGSVERLPPKLLSQLNEGGRLVAVVGQGNAAMAMAWLNDDGHVSSRALFNCAVPPLPGFARKAEFNF